MQPRDWLKHPLTRGLGIDDPSTTHLRKRIIREKQFLRRIYEEWYSLFAQALPAGPEPVLELGSGGGFTKDFVSGLIKSEVFFCPGVDTVLNGQQLPFDRNTLRGIVMTNVLHHLSEVRLFFYEASRCIRSDGIIAMIEPWVTNWSQFVYARLHHEPIMANARQWEFPSTGPLSSANSALAWIIFKRDRQQFEREYPEWSILSIQPFMPFRYLVSGGVSLRSLMPGWTFDSWRRLEYLLSPWMKHFAMFAKVILKRAYDSPKDAKIKPKLRE